MPDLGITINIFLLASWNQTEEDVRFAYRLAESTRGRVFFTADNELDRYVVWDYIKRRRRIISSNKNPHSGIAGTVSFVVLCLGESQPWLAS